MRIQYRIILLVIGLLTVSGVLSAILSGRLMDRILEEELGEKLSYVAHLLADSMGHHLINGEALEAWESLEHIVEIEDDIVYAYVVGFDGRIFAHSFIGGFPKDLLNENVSGPRHSDSKTKKYMFGEIPVTEMTYPLIEGMDAHVHIGMDETEMISQVKALNNRILAITTLVALAGILIGFLMSIRISRPLTHLTESVRAFGKSRLEEKADITGGGPEVTELTDAFNRMFTERARMEKALRESQQNLEITLFSIGDAVIATDTEGKVVRMNQVAESLTGWKLKEAVGQPLPEVFKIVNGMTRKEVENPVDKVLREGKIVGLANHTVLISRDGTEYQIADSGAPIMEKSGQVQGVVLVFRDVTEEYRLQQALKESEEKHRTLFETANDAILLADAETGIILDANKKAEMLFEMQKNELVGLHHTQLHPEQLADTYQSGFKEDMQQDGAIRSDMVIARKNGTLVPVELSEGMVRLEGRPMRLGIFRDITERKMAENAIRQSLKEKSILLGEVHHRVKNNMNVIISLLNLQSRYIKDKDALNIFRDSQNRIKTMARVHEKLYQSADFTRIDTGDYIKTLAKDLLQAYNVDTDRISLVVHADNILLSIDSLIPCGLIINELVSNSLKHAFKESQSGEILITLSADGPERSLVISDNGIGMSEEIEIDQTETLGLILVSSLVGQLRGKIEIDRTGGTTSTITFTEQEEKA